MRYSIAILIALLAACSPPATPQQDAGDAAPAPAPAQSAPVDEAAASCSRDCARLRALSCPAAATTLHGGTCEAVCANEQDAGVKRAWACRVAAKTCAEIDACR